MAPSTVASDVLLALACVVGAGWSLRQGDPVRRYASVGLSLMALAAAVGSLRYAGFESVVPLHRLSSAFAGAIAPGCFALVAVTVGRGWSKRVVELGLIALLLAWGVLDLGMHMGGYGTSVGTLAVLVMIGVGLWARGRAGVMLIAGAVTLALAGLVIGNNGTIGPLLRIDVFHVALAVAHLLIAKGLLGLRRGG